MHPDNTRTAIKKINDAFDIMTKLFLMQVLPGIILTHNSVKNG
ncbi:hypothetical protein CCP3SC15_5230002 [Gammaproteobacteria bacterium]